MFELALSQATAATHRVVILRSLVRSYVKIAVPSGILHARMDIATTSC